MCLEELFCPFTRDALNFRQPKIYDAPHRPVVSMFPLSLSLHHCACDAPLCSIIQLPPMLTGKADCAQITRRQEPTQQKLVEKTSMPDV